MKGRPPRLMITAGEASGDRLGAGLARALLERRPDIELFGMGGEQMSAAGVRLVQDAAPVAVVGFAEVLSHLPAIRRAMRALEQEIEQQRPDLLVPIDYPEFHLRLARFARGAGVPVVYFVSPQLWAWRPGRVRRIRQLVRRMMVLFPFETHFYEDAGVPVSFVGHPFADRSTSVASREEVCRKAGLDPARDIVALMPGSRRIEVSRVLPTMLSAAAELERERPGIQWLIPLASGLSESWLSERMAGPGPKDVRVHRGDYPEILGVCRAAVVAAGTATLDVALAGVPMVVVYRVGFVSWLVGMALLRVKHVALPNLIAGREIVPELMQSAFTPGAVATAVARYLDDPAEAERVREELLGVRGRLGGPGAFDRAADAVLGELEAALAAREL